MRAIEPTYLYIQSADNQFDFAKYDLLPGGSEYAARYNIQQIEIVLLDR